MFCYVTITHTSATSASWIYIYQIKPEIRTRSSSTTYLLSFEYGSVEASRNLLPSWFEDYGNSLRRFIHRPCIFKQMSFIILILICVFVIKFYNMNFSGYNDWSEGIPTIIFASLIADDEINGNIDLLVVPQYGRNLDHTG